VNAARAATGKIDAKEVQFVVKPVPWRLAKYGKWREGWRGHQKSLDK